MRKIQDGSSEMQNRFTYAIVREFVADRWIMKALYVQGRLVEKKFYADKKAKNIPPTTQPKKKGYVKNNTLLSFTETAIDGYTCKR